MENPQIENGYTKIANELLEALAKYRIPGEQRQCLDVILRKTYGYNKKQDSIALSQFVEMTGLKKPTVVRAIQGLLSKNLIYVIKKDNKPAHIYEFNKHYKQWVVLSKKITLSKKIISVIKKDNPSLSLLSTTKDNTTKEKKETFLSDSIEYRLAEYLFNHILKNNPKHKPVNIQSWAKSIDLMLRVDNREVEEIKQVIRWCQQDEFWRTNILSASKLREKYDALISKMNNKKGEPQTIIKQYINEATDVMG